MPRLTNKTYLKQRAHLRYEWLERNGGAMSWLKATEQWDIHGFFAPTDELTSEEALNHRHSVSLQQPSLPQQAGKAYARLQAIEDQLMKLSPPPTATKNVTRRNHRSKDLSIQVRALVRPEIDYEKLAAAFVEHAEYMSRKQEGEELKAA